MIFHAPFAGESRGTDFALPISDSCMLRFQVSNEAGVCSKRALVGGTNGALLDLLAGFALLFQIGQNLFRKVNLVLWRKLSGIPAYLHSAYVWGTKIVATGLLPTSITPTFPRLWCMLGQRFHGESFPFTRFLKILEK